MVGLPLLAATPVAAKPIEPNENSVQATVDSFVAYLKAETNEALKIAARMARDNKESLAAAKSYLDRQLSALRDLLSDRKATAGTLGKDAATTWEAWLPGCCRVMGDDRAPSCRGSRLDYKLDAQSVVVRSRTPRPLFDPFSRE